MTDWIKIPTEFHKDSEQLHQIIDAFVQFGISYRGQGPGIETMSLPTSHLWEFWIMPEDAVNASRIIATIMLPHEQEGSIPEDCEGCGTRIGTAKECPDCGLVRGWEPEGDDPLVAFLREHLGDELSW